MFEKIDQGFWKTFTSIMFLIIVCWPWIQDLWSKESKRIEQDMKGANGRWDWREIWERHSLRSAKGFYFALMFMLLKTTEGHEYPFWLWALFAMGVGGSGALAAFLITLRDKHLKQ